MQYVFLLTAISGLILSIVYFPVIVPGALVLIFGLIGYQNMHMRLYRKALPGGVNESAVSHVLPVFIAFLFLQAIYIYLSIIGLRDVISWPGIGSYWFLLFLFLFPGMVFQAMVAFFFLSKWKVPQRTRNIRIIAIISGVILVLVIYYQIDSVAMKKFEATYQPLVRMLHLHEDDPCNLLRSYVENNGLQGIHRPNAFYHTKDHFILKFWGKSIDMDGSTIFYDSAIKQWVMFHNDDLERVEELSGITSGMTMCPVGRF